MEAGIARMRDERLIEAAIGAVVVAIAVVFLVFVYSRAGHSLSGYEISAKLAKADGLGVGTDVRMAGIKIGSVSDLTLDPQSYLATVHMNIRNDIKIPDDSSLVVTSAGLLGSPYISVTPGGSDKMLKPGGMIENAQGSVDLMGLVGRFLGSSGGSQQEQKPSPQKPGPSP